MKKRLFVFPCLLLVVSSAKGEDAAPATGGNWPHWRGPGASGLVSNANPPIEWSEEKNIRWKIELTGHGLSTPIVWGDMVVIQSAISTKSNEPDKPTSPEAKNNTTSARKKPSAPAFPGEPAVVRIAREARERAASMTPEERAAAKEARQRSNRRGRRQVPTEVHRFEVTAVNRRNGEIMWTRTVREEVPHEGSHPDGSLAPASPVTDGEHIYAYFGSRGLYCLTMKGELVWEKDLGDMSTAAGFGEGSSPALYGDTIVINWDHEGDSFIVALDKKTGEEKWRRDRDEGTSWTTPLILQDANPPQVVVSATKRVRSYDLATGDLVWECGGLGAGCAASPIAGSDFVFAMSGNRNPAALAIKYQGAKGDLTGSDSVAWQLDKGTPYVPSPLLYGDTLYFLKKNRGLLSCYDPKTGKPYYAQQRLDKLQTVYASPVGANNKVYIAGRNGTTYVLERSKSFQVLAVNTLDDEFTASPAIVDDAIYLRGKNHLYCIASD